MLETLEALYPNENRTLLVYVMESAKNTILSLTNRKELLPQMETLVIQLASFLVTNNHQQGLASRSEGAISESYTDTSTIPSHLMRQILSHRLLRKVKY